MELTWVYGRTDPPRKKAGITGLYKAVPELLSSLRNQGQGMPTGLPHKEDREPSPAHTPLFCRIGIFGADFFSGKSMTIDHDERRRIDSLHLAAAWPSKDTHAFVPDDHLHPASLHSRYFTVRVREGSVLGGSGQRRELPRTAAPPRLRPPWRLGTAKPTRSFHCMINLKVLRLCKTMVSY